jgi:hypothetical protein
LTLEPLPDSFATTRSSLHALAEHVIAPARYRADGHIGLVATPGGFGTPHFGNDERIRVDGTELVHERPGSTTRVAITTIAAAAQFLGIAPGAPTEVYKPATDVAFDAHLAVTADGARALAAWIDFATSLLEEVRNAYSALAPTPIQMWPEHFDLSCDFGDADAGARANYGASPGDAAIPAPYLYVGPWDAARRTGALGTHGFGAALTYDDVRGGASERAAGLEFFRDGAALLVGEP